MLLHLNYKSLDNKCLVLRGFTVHAFWIIALNWNAFRIIATYFPQIISTYFPVFSKRIHCFGKQCNFRSVISYPAPNCIKDFLDLLGDSGQSGLTLQLFTNGDSGQSGLTLQLFSMETIVTSNLIVQINPINQWKCFIQLGADGKRVPVLPAVIWDENQA